MSFNSITCSASYNTLAFAMEEVVTMITLQLVLQHQKYAFKTMSYMLSFIYYYYYYLPVSVLYVNPLLILYYLELEYNNQ